MTRSFSIEWQLKTVYGTVTYTAAQSLILFTLKYFASG